MMGTLLLIVVLNFTEAMLWVEKAAWLNAIFLRRIVQSLRAAPLVSLFVVDLNLMKPDRGGADVFVFDEVFPAKRFVLL